MLYVCLHNPGAIGISEDLEEFVMEKLVDYVGTAVPGVNFYHQSHFVVVIWPVEIGSDFLMQWNCLKPHQQHLWHPWEEYLVVPAVTRK